MSALEAAILALTTKLVGRPSPGPSPTFIPSPKAPSGLTLRSTITASGTPTKTSWPEWVYVVAAGGGGGGNRTNGGGGAGACVQGWVKAADVGAVTIGAGGAEGSATAAQGSPTLVGPIRAPGGGGAAAAASNMTALNVEPGAGQGYTATSGSVVSDWANRPPAALHDIFVGGRITTSTKPAPATSGAGGSPNTEGGDGIQGPGGGGGANGSGSAGGKCESPNGSTYTGGVPATNVGGGGAGILANGGNGVAATSAGAGGSGGGGGGGSDTSSKPAGAGGNGAVLIYY